MKQLVDTITAGVQSLITEYNGNSQLNSFLYNNSVAHDVFKAKCGDRGQLITRCNQIEKELTPIMHDMYHGRKVIVQGDRFNPGPIEGVIHHPLTREFEGRTLTNETSFRAIDHTVSHQDQTIALWVVTENRHSTHLYTINNIQLVD